MFPSVYNLFLLFVFGAELQIDQIQGLDVQRRECGSPRRHENFEDVKLPATGFFSIVEIAREPDGHDGSEKDRGNRQNVVEVHGLLLS
jgi:hypothetical protein